MCIHRVLDLDELAVFLAHTSGPRRAGALPRHRVTWSNTARRGRAAPARGAARSGARRAVRSLERPHLARQRARGRQGRAGARRAGGVEVGSKDPDRRMCRASPPAPPHPPRRPAVVPPATHHLFSAGAAPQKSQSPHAKGFVELALGRSGCAVKATPAVTWAGDLGAERARPGPGRICVPGLARDARRGGRLGRF